MARLHVFISTSSFGKLDPEPFHRLKANGITFHTNPFGRTLSEGEIAQFIMNVDGIIAGTEPLTRAVLSQATRLKVISRCGVGLDNVDLEAAKELDIVVTNTSHAHDRAVAELTIGAMLALLRNIPQNDRAVRAGKWEKAMGQLLHDRIVGIIGTGKVGKAVIRSLQSFGVKIVAYDLVPDVSFAARNDVKYTTLTKLIREAEIVSLHMPYSRQVHHLLNRTLLGQMRQGTFVINTSRGGLIDEEALYHFLKIGKLAGAFIDTFETEPYHGPLTQIPNAILSPHIGAYAQDARLAMELEAVENVARVLKKGDGK